MEKGFLYKFPSVIILLLLSLSLLYKVSTFCLRSPFPVKSNPPPPPSTFLPTTTTTYFIYGGATPGERERKKRLLASHKMVETDRECVWGGGGISPDGHGFQKYNKLHHHHHHRQEERALPIPYVRRSSSSSEREKQFRPEL